MSYPIEKYKFITFGNKVVALSTYAGKKVRGVASCDPKDTFSLDSGKKLAAARCALKVAEKRVKRAEKKVIEAEETEMLAYNHLGNMQDYLDNSYGELYDAQDELAALLAEM